MYTVDSVPSLCGSASARGLIGLGKLIMSVVTADRVNVECVDYTTITEDLTEPAY